MKREMKRPLRVPALFLVLAAPALRAQDSVQRYDLRTSWVPRVGVKSDLTDALSMSMKITNRAGDRVVSEREKKMKYEFAALDEILTVSEGRVRTHSLSFSKAVTVRDGAETVHGFQGKSVVLEELGGQKMDVRLTDGSSLSDEDAQAMSKCFTGVKADRGEESSILAFLVPEKPVAPGESWEPPVGKLLTQMFSSSSSGITGDVDPEKSKARFTLKSVEVRNGATFGKVEGSLDFEFVRLGPLKLDAPYKGHVTLSFDSSIDGKSPDTDIRMTTEITGAGRLTGPDVPPESVFEIKMTLQARYTRQTIR